MQEEGKRPCSQPLHEQLSPPAGIHSLSTPPSSLTTPLPLKKKKLLKVILKSPPTPNPNRLSPSLSSSPSSPPPLSPSSLSTPSLLPPHHHHLQQHQLHHHQQLLLQQQHLHKQKLLHQQTQQLASELQLKLHQQHLLQQEHPKLLEQFKQQLEQEQICASSSDLQGNSQQSTGSGSRDRRRNLKGESPQQEVAEFHEKGRSTQEERRNASSGRRRARSRDFSCDALSEEQFALPKSRFHSEGEASFGHSLQANADTPFEFYSNGQEQPSLQMQENIHREGEPSSKRLKISEQHIEENQDVRNPLRSPVGQRNKVPIAGYNGLPHMQRPLPNGLLSSPRLANVSSSAAILEASEAKRLHPAGNSASSLVQHSFAKPVSEGIRHKDGTVTVPSSKTLGGSGNASVPGRKVLRGILDKLQKKDSYGAFSEPVDAKEVPDYYDVIKDPMDFGTMRKRISSGFYTSLELFEKDIFAICSNAMTFNATGTVYHRQARAIKAAAERILEPLKTPGSAGADEGVLKQKVGLPQMKKSHKKKQPWKPWTSDYVSEPLPNLDGRGTGRVPTSYLADSYYVDWQAGIGQTSNKMNTDDKDDTMGYLAKSLGLNEGRRLLLNEESRRGTYKPIANAGSGSLVNTVGGCPLQFVPAGFQIDFSYARSLARFAADLGPDVWKVAGEKIRRALPMGVPFGPGWVGQREVPGRAVPLTNKSPTPNSVDSQGKGENIPNDGVLATADIQRTGNSSVVMSGASGAADSKGVAILSDQKPLANDRWVKQRYVEEPRPSEPSHFSQAAHQVPLEGGTRNAQHLLNWDGDQGVRRREISFPSQGACQGGVDENDLTNCEGDVVLIPGRDLDGRGCLDYKNTQASVLHLNPGPVTLIEGVQPRLNEDG